MRARILIGAAAAVLAACAWAAPVALAAPAHPAAHSAVLAGGSQDDGYICEPLCIQSNGYENIVTTTAKNANTTNWVCIYAAVGCQFEQYGTSDCLAWYNGIATDSFITEPCVTPAPTWQEFYNAPAGTGGDFTMYSEYLSQWLVCEGPGESIGNTTLKSDATLWDASNL